MRPLSEIAGLDIAQKLADSNIAQGRFYIHNLFQGFLHYHEKTADWNHEIVH